MSSSVSRYDEIAEWYCDFTGDWLPEPIALPPADVRGRRVLDMACGYGPASRYLAARGATVTGVDLSSRLLARAAAMEASEPLGITYVQGDVSATEWWDGESFDGVLCNMALMDIDDLDGALATAARVVETRGWFSMSVLHPCFPGGPDAQPSWPPDRGYSWEGLWNTNGVGVRGHASVNHRTLSTYLNAMVRAGFELEEFAEPRSPVPRYLTVCGRRR